MKNKIDKILLGILWLLAMALVASFWFNAKFGFNLFSATHWHHLAYMQASSSSIKSSFYISLVIISIITVTGLYVLVRPRFRRIKLSPAPATSAPTKTPVTQTPSAAPVAPITPTPLPQPKTIAPIAPTPLPQSTPNMDARPVTTPSVTRPPRLNIPLGTLPQTPPPPQINITAPSPAPAPAPTQSAIMEYPEIREIFTNAGYTLKSALKIDGTPITLVAIGTNENMWLGGVGIKTTDMAHTSEKFAQIFSDTLEDIDININSFIVAAPDAASYTDGDILMFDSISSLRQYMANIPNPPPTDNDDNDNFNAYSDYIDTVLNYIAKV